MTLYDIVNDWDHISLAKRKEALTKAVAYVCDQNDHSFMYYLTAELADAEADDYFGTEGLSV